MSASAATSPTWRRARGRRDAATVPHQHVFGLPFKLAWPLAAGRPFATVSHQYWEALFADLPAGAVLVSSPAHLSRAGGLPPLTGPPGRAWC